MRAVFVAGPRLLHVVKPTIAFKKNDGACLSSGPCLVKDLRQLSRKETKNKGLAPIISDERKGKPLINTATSTALLNKYLPNNHLIHPIARTYNEDSSNAVLSLNSAQFFQKLHDFTDCMYVQTSPVAGKPKFVKGTHMVVNLALDSVRNRFFLVNAANGLYVAENRASNSVGCSNYQSSATAGWHHSIVMPSCPTVGRRGR